MIEHFVVQRKDSCYTEWVTVHYHVKVILGAVLCAVFEWFIHIW